MWHCDTDYNLEQVFVFLSRPKVMSSRGCAVLGALEARLRFDFDGREGQHQNDTLSLILETTLVFGSIHGYVQERWS